jgi:predicted RNase H-like nuclease (RuvC/YqgF family)
MDRDYWRSEPTKRLVEEARTKGCELCIALGERLEEADDKIETAESESEDRAIDNDREIGRLHEKIEELELMLGQREDRIEELEAQRNKETKK